LFWNRFIYYQKAVLKICFDVLVRGPNLLRQQSLFGVSKAFSGETGETWSLKLVKLGPEKLGASRVWPNQSRSEPEIET